jgi:hypothetical protein
MIEQAKGTARCDGVLIPSAIHLNKTKAQPFNRLSSFASRTVEAALFFMYVHFSIPTPNYYLWNGHIEDVFCKEINNFSWKKKKIGFEGWEKDTSIVL